MAERGFPTELWTDPWFQGLSCLQRYLFIYLGNNEHCRQSGLYRITLETIAFETKLPVGDIPDLLKGLEPEVEWRPAEHIIWVKNFVKRQCKSPKFLVAAGKCLKGVENNGLIKEFLEYNKSLGLLIPYEYGGGSNGVSIRYQYTIDTPTTPSTLVPITGSGSVKGRETGRKGVVKGGKTGLAATTATGTATESELLGFLETLEGWRFRKADDLVWLRDFRQDWPDFDLSLAKACRDYHSGRTSPKHKGTWKNRFREWMKHEREYKEEQHGRTGEHRQDTVEAMRAEGWTESEPDEPGKAD